MYLVYKRWVKIVISVLQFLIVFGSIQNRNFSSFTAHDYCRERIRADPH